MNQEESKTQEAPAGAASLPATLRLGAVHLTVSDLDRSLGFYEGALGLTPRLREAGMAAVGVGEEDLVVLHEEPGVRRAGHHAGLYHYALLYPSREELARAAARLAATGTPLRGASDHGTHEAIYLPDPDRNGIELAADRPRGEWPRAGDGGLAMVIEPLDLAGLLATVPGEEPPREAGPGLQIGHVHLHVGDLERGLAFYRDALGFELTASIPGAAAFVSAGGYHHHLGFNVWRGEGIPPAPPGRVGLRHWTVVLDDPGEVETARERVLAAGIEAGESEGGLGEGGLGEGGLGEGGFLVRDPWGIAARFVTSGAPVDLRDHVGRASGGPGGS